MDRTEVAKAKFLNFLVCLTDERGKKRNLEVGLDIFKNLDEEGNFSLSHSKGEVLEVHYWNYGECGLGGERKHSLSFQEYLKLDKPSVVSCNVDRKYEKVA